jgi:hypothetical protein
VEEEMKEWVACFISEVDRIEAFYLTKLRELDCGFCELYKQFEKTFDKKNED